MSRTANTFNVDERAALERGYTPRFVQEALLVVGLAAWVFLLLAILSYSPSDPAWSTTGSASGLRNWGGVLGAWLADVLYWLFGFSAWWLIIVGGVRWWRAVSRWMRGGVGPGAVGRQPHKNLPDGQGSQLVRAWRWARSVHWVFWVGLALLMASSTGLEATRLYHLDQALPGQAGGLFGQLGGQLAVRWLGFTGSALMAIIALLVSLGLVFRFSWGRVAERVGAGLEALVESRRASREKAQDLAQGREAARERSDEVVQVRGQAEKKRVVPIIIEPTLTEVPKSERVVREKQKPLFSEMPDSPLPQVDLLDPAPDQGESVSAETLEMTSRMIEKKLSDFGVGVTVVAASPGPVVTRYEIEPATGVKGSQIVNLAKDLARSLSLVSIRVIETIPGKNYMALELPNAKRQIIHLSEILGSQVYNDARSLLTVGLGKDIVGKPVVANLGKMPHVLVAGTTGSGKSVGINAMILSLLYKAEPKDVRLLLIDPKMLEMSVYEGIPHLIAPVVTDMAQAGHALNWCVAEMERRYKLMSKMGVRNLAGFNQKIAQAESRGESIPNPFSLTPEEPEPLEHQPHLVIVIDELADLMMVVGKKVEELIARLAQKARAAGIHLILATQRPSVDVITGLIKANVPTRISFHVSSKVDSRTILDQMGAENLLGMGDMLYLANGSSIPTRVHGAFVSDDEVHRVVDHLKQFGEADYVEGILEGGSGEDGSMLDLTDTDGEKDPVYDEAVAVVLKNRRASISLVQRHLRIGYNRAARLVEDMENAGLVSAMDGSGKREILVPVPDDL